MKTKTNFIEEVDIAAFAERHDLTMCINERPPGMGVRYYARFESCEVIDGSCLVGIYGNGRTPDEAISGYAEALSHKRVAVDAYTDKRKELNVPKLSYTPTQEGGL